MSAAEVVVSTIVVEPSTWNTALKPLLLWDDCKLANQYPSNAWARLFDRGFKKYACYHLWKAQGVRNDLQKDTLLKDYPDKYRERLTFLWSRLHQLAQEYREEIKASHWKEARSISKSIAAASEAFGNFQTESDSTVKDLLIEKEREKARQEQEAKRVMLEQERAQSEKDALEKKANRKSQNMEILLSKKVMETMILVHGESLADLNVQYRKDAIAEVIKWLNGCCAGNDQEKRVFWLHGKQGCGKSVIAHYIAKICNSEKALAVGYVFQNGFSEPQWQNFTASLSLDFITYFGLPFKASLITQVESPGVLPNMETFLNQSPAYQFRTLFAPAWKEVPLKDRKPMIGILDGLERCSDWSIRHICTLIRESVSPDQDLPIYWIVSSEDTPLVRLNLTVREGFGNKVAEYQLALYEPDEVDDPTGDAEAGGDEDNNGPTPTLASFQNDQQPDSVELMSSVGVLVGKDEDIQHDGSQGDQYTSLVHGYESEDEKSDEDEKD